VARVKNLPPPENTTKIIQSKQPIVIYIFSNLLRLIVTKAKLVYSTSANSKPWGWAAHEKGICRPDGGS